MKAIRWFIARVMTLPSTLPVTSRGLGRELPQVAVYPMKLKLRTYLKLINSHPLGPSLRQGSGGRVKVVMGGTGWSGDRRQGVGGEGRWQDARSG